MTTFGRPMARLVAGAVPVIGLSAAAFHIKAVHAEDISPRKLYKANKLPLDDHLEQEKMAGPHEVYPRNVVEEYISYGRRNVQEMLSTFTSQVAVVTDKINIGWEHTTASLDYVQTNPGELPRIALILTAATGGVVLGYRGGTLRKFAYSSIAATSTAALCYPKKTVDLSKFVASEVKELWKGSGEVQSDVKLEPVASKLGPVASKGTQSVNVALAKKQLVKDSGQSDPEDKDMYSTRGSPS